MAPWSQKSGIPPAASTLAGSNPSFWQTHTHTRNEIFMTARKEAEHFSFRGKKIQKFQDPSVRATNVYLRIIVDPERKSQVINGLPVAVSVAFSKYH